MTDLLVGQLQQFIRELMQPIDANRIDYIYHMLDQINRRISHIFYSDENSERLEHIGNHLLSIENEVLGEERITDYHFAITTAINGIRGRPKFQVNMDQVVYLISQGIKCSQISSMLGVSLRTLKRRMSNDGISVAKCFLNVNNEELDRIVLNVCTSFPGIGYRRLLSELM